LQPTAHVNAFRQAEGVTCALHEIQPFDDHSRLIDARDHRAHVTFELTKLVIKPGVRCCQAQEHTTVSARHKSKRGVDVARPAPAIHAIEFVELMLLRALYTRTNKREKTIIIRPFARVKSVAHGNIHDRALMSAIRARTINFQKDKIARGCQQLKMPSGLVRDTFQQPTVMQKRHAFNPRSSNRRNSGNIGKSIASTSRSLCS
jgi:hypothetical protein